MRVTESQNESVNESVNERTPEIKIVNLEIVDFLHLDISKITFTKPKPNKHNGTQIGILYNGKTLFVKYDGYTPFGLNEKYDKNGEYQGTSIQINCEGEYLEKAKELDQFFIDYIHTYIHTYIRLLTTSPKGLFSANYKGKNKNKTYNNYLKLQLQIIRISFLPLKFV